MSLINDVKLPSTPSTGWTDFTSKLSLDSGGKVSAPTTTAPSTTIPVANVSTPQAPVPTLVQPSRTTNVKNSIANITSGIGDVQRLLDQKIAKDKASAGSTLGTTTGTTTGGSLRDSYLDNFLTEGQRDLAGDKEAIREQELLKEKADLARESFNYIRQRRMEYEDQIREVEQNPTGMLRGAQNAEINKIKQEASREMANLAIEYDVLNGDFLSAQSRVDARIADLDADKQSKTDMWAKAFEFAGDTMTDEEELVAKQNFEKTMAQFDFDNDKEIALLNDRLARERSAIDYSRSQAGAETSAFNPAQMSKEYDSIKSLDTLGLHKGLSKAVGAYGLARFTPFSIDKSAKNEFLGIVDEFTNILTVDTYAEAKARGLTFGAMTESEWNILRKSASKLGSWRKTDKEGNTTHYEVSEKAFMDEINTLNYRKKLNYVLGGGNPTDIGAQFREEDKTWWVKYGDSYRQLEANPE